MRDELALGRGFGKTIHTIAAGALLRHLGKARRVLVVTPASLKREWEEQIRRFTNLPPRLVSGGRALRARLYAEAEPPFFTIANCEQILADSLDINARLRAHIVVLDEAQRIKNWSTKTAQAVKRLASRYAFVVTGTPIENRIDGLRSIVDFLDPALLGPLFRFNREYYALDDNGRPAGYRNLARLRERVRPKEQDLLMVLLNMLRMICDTPGIMKDNPSRECPRLDELACVLDERLADAYVKDIVFSEWTGMLQRVREWADERRIGYSK